MIYHKSKYRGLGLGIVLLLLVFVFCPLPYFIESPGTAQSSSRVIKFKAKPEYSTDKLLFTTVRIQQATPLTITLAQLTPFNDVISRKDLMADSNTAEYNQMEKYYMENAGNNAIEAAFKKAQQPIHKKYLGIYVMSILANSPAKKVLKVGDVISKIDGHRFASSAAFMHYIHTQRVYHQVTITYQRHGQTRVVKSTLMKLPQTKQVGLGISLVDHVHVQTKPRVQVKAGDIGGPSAGLMFTLQIYSQLTRHDLTHGRIIAGTGTITPEGKVGPIGGIDKKVYAANKAGAKVFLAPRDKVTKAKLKLDSHYQSNYQTAKKAAQRLHTSMKIVPVDNLNQAINYLEAHH
ncbi:PDZ domain-containing protein [Bombilactobacillus folatiphilus]|uniref:endopeptidase La n=1 Tax=Bombilactobacillus folatiphilus TaxID=2923362 RepID=A0ABY4PAV9_9LACO|nr:SepM family pheromone-processing serine protease [Bombilactobacillus folatiphilus]UQS82740.1 PDZ domain-containing protein [Bombilactobacillus folatiphilus]